MSSQLQEKEDAIEAKGKSRFFNPFTGKDPFEEDIKKGLTIEEMKKRLQERSSHEKIKYLESLLSRKGSSLKKGTVHGMEEIISESYKFFGDEMADKGHYERAAKSYKSAGEDDLAKKAWKQAGDSHMAAAQSQSSTGTAAPPAEYFSAYHEEDRKQNTKAGKPAEKKAEKIKETVESKTVKPETESGKNETVAKGKKRKSNFALAAEAYENAGEFDMASAAWKLAGDDYLNLAESGDRRYLDDSLDCYKKGKQFKQAVFVSLLAGKPTKSIEEMAKKGNLGKKDFVLMANDFLARSYFHASRFLFSLAGEKDLADRVSGMEKENKK